MTMYHIIFNSRKFLGIPYTINIQSSVEYTNVSVYNTTICFIYIK